MKIKKTTAGAVIGVISIALISIAYIGYTQFLSPSDYALKIISLDLTKPDTGTNFSVSIQIKNVGEKSIQDANLHIIFIKDNDIIDSQKQSFSIQTTEQSTYQAHFIDINFKTGSEYKVIASIYLNNESLDSKSITKQF
jgi:hypothetical protein